MADYNIRFRVDGKEVTQEEIREMELSRYRLVFAELLDKGVTPTLEGRPLTAQDLANMGLSQLTKALAETREALGREKTLQLYAEELAQGDAMWHDIAQNSAYRSNLKPGIVEVETTGISLEQFVLFNKSLEEKDNLYLPSTMHPEHYFFKAGEHGSQIIVERFGQYKYPVYLKLEQPDKGDDYTPVPLDKDTVFAMKGVTRLMSDLSDTKIVDMHQFKQKKDGLKVKLGVYLPEAAPDEMVKGHQWHLMVEFNNALHAAAQIKPNFFQKLVLKLALSRLKRKNHVASKQ